MHAIIRLVSALALLAEVTSVAASPVANKRDTYAVKEYHPVPRKWERLGDPSRDHMLHLHIALKQEQPGQLERHLLEGTPTSLSSPSDLQLLEPDSDANTADSLGANTPPVWPTSHVGPSQRTSQAVRRHFEQGPRLAV